MGSPAPRRCAHRHLAEHNQQGPRFTWHLDFSWAELTLTWHVRVWLYKLLKRPELLRQLGNAAPA